MQQLHHGMARAMARIVEQLNNAPRDPNRHERRRHARLVRTTEHRGAANLVRRRYVAAD